VKVVEKKLVAEMLVVFRIEMAGPRRSYAGAMRVGHFSRA